MMDYLNAQMEATHKVVILNMPYLEFYEIIWRLMKYAEEKVRFHDYSPTRQEGIIYFN